MPQFTIRTLDRGDHISARAIPVKTEDTLNTRHKEYIRAVKEVKLDHLFRKPFVAALEGHTEGITRIVGSPTVDSLIASMDYNGEINTWDLSKKEVLLKIPSAESEHRAICFLKDSLLYSRKEHIVLVDSVSGEQKSEFISGALPLDISSIGEAYVASTVDGIEIFDPERIRPIASYRTDRQAKRVLFASRSVIYTAESTHLSGYDSRTGNKEFYMTAPTDINAFSINPSKSTEIATALSSGEIRIYDTLYSSRSSEHKTPPSRTIKGHASPVLDIQYLPNGKKLITGSSDQTVRIFGNTLTHSQEHIYHNKRMLLVNAVFCTPDNNFILSGSTDANIRIWKADPNNSMKILNTREEHARAIGNALKRKYSAVKEISDLKRHILLPRKLKALSRNRYHQDQAQKRKDKNAKENGGQ
ncbi:DDB1- and CUL4-associated factor 13 [Nematocida sp. LUAm1]|nr:DDB1- and CUL4-associated factor 13 [Nematocida sp. LUAm2]KAI5177631.1 DDB1- and CUL4-associated factor 13 [Nematocida sp. LUAm1]